GRRGRRGPAVDRPRGQRDTAERDAATYRVQLPVLERASAFEFFQAHLHYGAPLLCGAECAAPPCVSQAAVKFASRVVTWGTARAPDPRYAPAARGRDSWPAALRLRGAARLTRFLARASV